MSTTTSDNHQLICLCENPVLTPLNYPSFRNGRSLFRCSSCGMHQLYPYPVATNYDSTIYSNPEYLKKISGEEYYGYFMVLYDLALSHLITKKSSILDFGAGHCYYHKYLQQLGHNNVYSLEINKHLVQFAREKLGLENVVTSFCELSAQFDLILANQVFEHMLDPVAFIENVLGEQLKLNGYLVFTVPNYASFNRVVLGHRWIGFSADEHIWFFDESSVRRVFEKSNYYTIQKTLVRSAINTRHDRFHPSHAFKLIYYKTCMSLFEWMGRGDQLIVILRKRS